MKCLAGLSCNTKGDCKAVGLIDSILKNSVAFLTENWPSGLSNIFSSESVHSQFLYEVILPSSLFQAVK